MIKNKRIICLTLISKISFLLTNLYSSSAINNSQANIRAELMDGHLLRLIKSKYIQNHRYFDTLFLMSIHNTLLLLIILIYEKY